MLPSSLQRASRKDRDTWPLSRDLAPGSFRNCPQIMQRVPAEASSWSRDRTSRRSRRRSRGCSARVTCGPARPSTGGWRCYFILKAMEFPAGLRDHRPRPHVLGRAGDRPRGRAEAGVRRHRPGHLHAVSGGDGARHHAEYARRAADTPLRHGVRHGPHPGAGAAAQPEGDRGLCALTRRRHTGDAMVGHARRCELLQLPGIQAAEHLRRRPGVDARRRPRPARRRVRRR